MKPYIDLNIEKMKEATMRGEKAGKDLFKLFNNAVLGKTMLNLRKPINFEVVTSRKVALKRIASVRRYSVWIWVVFTWSSQYW